MYSVDVAIVVLLPSATKPPSKIPKNISLLPSATSISRDNAVDVNDAPLKKNKK